MTNLQEDKLELAPERNAGRVFIFIFCFLLFLGGIYAFGLAFVVETANIWWATGGLLTTCAAVFIAMYYPESEK